MGDLLGNLHPEDTEWVHTLNQYGTINFDLSLDSPLCKKRYLTPYMTDFKFFMGDRLEMEGIITDLQFPQLTSESVKVSGRSYLHYLEKRYWPFDPGNPNYFTRSWFEQDVVLVIESMLDEVLTQGGSLDFSYNNDPVGIPVNYRIEPADSETIYDKIVQLSGQEPGFDFWEGEGRVLYIAKERGSKTSITLNLTDLTDVVWNNQGPRATHLLGLGAGTSSRLGISLDSAEGLERVQRRYDAIEDFGAVVDEYMLTNLTVAELEKQVHDSEIVSASTMHDEFTAHVQPGDTIGVHVDLGVTCITHDSRVQSITGKMNLQGDQFYDITFEADSDA
jgi:hypothetical protein